jgi:hypothetical protein
MVNRAVLEIAADFPRHEQSKRDPKENQGRDIDGRESAPLDSRKERFHRQPVGMRAF